LNDSSATCGSRLDRHENIGQGAIGLKGFRAIVRERRLRGLPGIIETPGFDRAGPDRRNLEILRALRGRRG
jgi:deoxyribonuclease-4